MDLKRPRNASSSASSGSGGSGGSGGSADNDFECGFVELRLPFGTEVPPVFIDNSDAAHISLLLRIGASADKYAKSDLFEKEVTAKVNARRLGLEAEAESLRALLAREQQTSADALKVALAAARSADRETFDAEKRACLAQKSAEIAQLQIRAADADFERGRLAEERGVLERQRLAQYEASSTLCATEAARYEAQAAKTAAASADFSATIRSRTVKHEAEMSAERAAAREDRALLASLSREVASLHAGIQKQAAAHEAHVAALLLDKSKVSNNKISGNLGENQLLGLLRGNLRDATVADVSNMAKQTDFYVTYRDGLKSLWDSKNHAPTTSTGKENRISNDEIAKFKEQLCAHADVDIGFLVGLRTGFVNLSDDPWSFEVIGRQIVVYVNALLDQPSPAFFLRHLDLEVRKIATHTRVMLASGASASKIAEFQSCIQQALGKNAGLRTILTKWFVSTQQQYEAALRKLDEERLLLLKPSADDET